MGGWKMPKRVKAGARPKVEKQVRAAKRPNLYQLSPKWSFIKCDMQHEKWGISNNTEHLGDMLARFKEWERGTWGEILTTTSGRKHNTQSHPMPVEILNKEAAKRLTELNLDSYDVLYSLTITGKQRVWGIMIEETDTFQLLWYDSQHEIYPV